MYSTSLHSIIQASIGLWASVFLYLGLRALISGQPFLLRSRVIIGLLVICFLPILFSFVQLFSVQSLTLTTSLSLFLGTTILFVLLTLYLQCSEVAVAAIGEHDFRSSVEEALKRAKYAFERTDSTRIRLKELDTELLVSHDSRLKVGYVRTQDRKGREIVSKISKELEREISRRDTLRAGIPVSATYFVLSIAIGMTAVIV